MILINPNYIENTLIRDQKEKGKPFPRLVVSSALLPLPPSKPTATSACLSPSSVQSPPPRRRRRMFLPFPTNMQHLTLTSSSTNELSLSFSSSLSRPLNPSPLPFRPISLQPLRILSVAVNPQHEQPKDERLRPLPENSPQRLLKELAQRKKYAAPPNKRPPPKRFILKPPLDDKRLAERFLNSPQLSLRSFPLLSSCLPSAKLNSADTTWISEYLLEAKQALGYPLEPSDALDEDNPAKQFDALLYLAFQHGKGSGSERMRARHVRYGHSRLWFLGQYVLELGLAELLLQRYPRESPGPMRERVFALVGKWRLPKRIEASGLANLVFPYDVIAKLTRRDREAPAK